MSLLTRSFLLIALLIVTAVLASFQIYRVYEREPRSTELAQQTVSAVNLTRAALVNADPFRRRELLIELNESEGLRVFPATASEKLEALPEDSLLDRVVPRVRQALGADTRFASERDGEDGFWVSFYIDEDEYWVMLPWERFEPELSLQWLSWGLVLLALALAGAWFIASNLARPLAALTAAAGRLGRGEAHRPLAEEGARELRLLSAAFNRMAGGLESMERERAMVLAGISHDLRTPLSRLRLSLEMSGASPARSRRSRPTSTKWTPSSASSSTSRAARTSARKTMTCAACSRSSRSTTPVSAGSWPSSGASISFPLRPDGGPQGNREPDRQRAALRGRSNRGRQLQARRRTRWSKCAIEDRAFRKARPSG